MLLDQFVCSFLHLSSKVLRGMAQLHTCAYPTAFQFPFAPVIIPAPLPLATSLSLPCPTVTSSGSTDPAIPTSTTSPERTGPTIPTSANVPSRSTRTGPTTGTAAPIQHYFLPDVLLWDPFQQYSSLFKNAFLCPEDGCNTLMHFLTWQDGSKERYRPRTLYGLNGIVLLVGQIFRCSHGHLITNYDPRLLNIFPDRSCLPFMLLHKCGLTLELVNYIFSLASQGMDFTNICNAIKGNCDARYYRSQLAYWCNEYGSGPSCCTPASPVTFPEIAPQTMSNDVVMNCFVVKFKELENMFTSTMSAMTGSHLSCDTHIQTCKTYWDNEGWKMGFPV